MGIANRRALIGKFGVIITVVLVGFLLFNGAKYVAMYRFKRFKNLEFSIATTKTKDCNKSGCHINYTYTVNGHLYGGSAQGGNAFRYPDVNYYVVYSKDDPKLQVILPDYPIDQTIDLYTITDDYYIERLMDYGRTDTKEDWGAILWHDYFEVATDE